MQGFRWQLPPPPPLSLQRFTGPNATAADRPMGSTSSCRALTPITKTGPALHRLSAISVPIGTWLDNTPKHTSFHLYKQYAPTSNFAYQVQRVLTLLKNWRPYKKNFCTSIFTDYFYSLLRWSVEEEILRIQTFFLSISNIYCAAHTSKTVSKKSESTMNIMTLLCVSTLWQKKQIFFIQCDTRVHKFTELVNSAGRDLKR